MLKNRVIPCLLLRNNGLVKTVRFKDPKYVGDPINAVRIFNEKEVDELIFLDIDASKKGASPNFGLIKDIALECFMPFCYGGGVRAIEDIRKIFSLGAEKVSINSAGLRNPALIKEAAATFGSQSVVAAIDVKKDFLGRYRVYDHSKNKTINIDPVEFARKATGMGAGEILINSVDRDGTGEGYDLELVRKVSDSVTVPIIALGGAGNVDDIVKAIKEGRASAAAAGSMFVFHGKYRAVLITYPDYKELKQALK